MNTKREAEKTMKKLIHILILTFLISAFELTGEGSASFEFKESDARAAGLAGAYTAVTEDAESVWYNPAGLRFCRAVNTNALYTNLYGMGDLSYTALSVAVPTMLAGTWGLGFSVFGNSDYKESDMRLAFASGLGSGMYAGITLKRETIDISGTDKAGATGIDLGVSANINEYLRMSAASFNINNPTLGETRESIARRFMMGLAANPYPGIQASFDIHKPLEKDIQTRMGIELELNDMLILRAGTQIKPSRFGFGFSTLFSIFSLDYAFITHTALSTQHLFSLSMLFENTGQSGRRGMSISHEEKIGFVGKININRASVHRLMRLPGVGKTTAKKIIEYREKSGEFRSINEVMNIYGLPRSVYDSIKNYITVEEDADRFRRKRVQPEESDEYEIIREKTPGEDEYPSGQEMIYESYDQPEPEEETDVIMEQDEDIIIVPVKQPEDIEYYEEDPVREEIPAEDTLEEPVSVNINTASAGELESIQGITYPLAKSIIRYRKSHGAFSDWNDLLNIPGVNGRIIEMLKESGKL